MDTNNAEYKKGYDEAIEYIKKLLNQGASGKDPKQELDPQDDRNKLDNPNVPQEDEDETEFTPGPRTQSSGKKPQQPKPSDGKQKTDKKDEIKIGDRGNEEIQKKEAEERAKNAEFDDAGNKIGSPESKNASKNDVDARISQLKDILSSSDISQGID